MAKAKKVTRKELLKKDDAFLAAAGQGARWIVENRTQVIVGSILAVTAILGTWGVVEYIRDRDQRASTLFGRGLEILGAEVLPAGSEQEPDPEAIEPTFATEEDKWNAARDQFDEVVRETGGSGVATLAELMSADLSEKLGDAETAEKKFLGLVEGMSSGDSLYFLAVERAAYLQEARGDADGALRTLSKLVNADTGFYNDSASFHQARLYVDRGESTRARNILERIENDFPSSSLLDDVRERLEQLGPPPVDDTPAGTPSPTEESPTGNQASAPAEADATGEAVEAPTPTPAEPGPDAPAEPGSETAAAESTP